jgi:hypothetical protein
MKARLSDLNGAILGKRTLQAQPRRAAQMLPSAGSRIGMAAEARHAGYMTNGVISTFRQRRFTGSISDR